MKFFTAINCMDGRVQLPVIEYLLKRFNVTYVDMITEPGPNLILANQIESDMVQSVFNRIDISIDKHKSVGIAVVGHHDCVGNPSDKEQQKIHTLKAIQVIKQKFSDIEIIGLWVDENWQVNEIRK